MAIISYNEEKYDECLIMAQNIKRNMSVKNNITSAINGLDSRVSSGVSSTVSTAAKKIELAEKKIGELIETINIMISTSTSVTKKLELSASNLPKTLSMDALNSGNTNLTYGYTKNQLTELLTNPNTAEMASAMITVNWLTENIFNLTGKKIANTGGTAASTRSLNNPLNLARHSGASLLISGSSLIGLPISFNSALRSSKTGAKLGTYVPGIYKKHMTSSNSHSKSANSQVNKSSIGNLVSSTASQRIEGIKQEQEQQARWYEEAVFRNDIVDTSRSAIGTPYDWGGEDLNAGVDCSGLVRASYAEKGVDVPHQTGAIYESDLFEHVNSVDELKPGDLIQYGGSGSNGHIGIYTGDGTVVHAPATGNPVREDSLEEYYNWSEPSGEGPYYLHYVDN